MDAVLFQPEYQFVRRAIFAAILASVSLGIVGTFVVVRRIGYLAAAISHCAFGGIGIGLLLQHSVAVGLCVPLLRPEIAKHLHPTTVAVCFSVLCAVLIGWVRSCAKEREDSIIGAIWAIGMSLGILCINQTPQASNISSYLFGDLFWVTNTDCFTIVVWGTVLLAVTLVVFKRLEAVCFDEEFATLRGVPATWYFYGLLVFSAITVVIMVRLVGMLLVIALLTLPAATAGRLTTRLFPMMMVSIFLCAFVSVAGIGLCLYFDCAAGPMIVLVAATGYGATFCKRK